MIVIDTVEYVDMLRNLTESGNTVNMLISGNSMAPFLIHQRDYIYFEKPKRELKKGDPVFYQRDNGQYIMHRICRVNPDGSYDMIGDNQRGIEKGIRRDQIFALIIMIKRKDKLIKPGDLWWEFFSKIWVNIIPCRGIVQKIYRGLTFWKR